MRNVTGFYITVDSGKERQWRITKLYVKGKLRKVFNEFNKYIVMRRDKGKRVLWSTISIWI